MSTEIQTQSLQERIAAARLATERDRLDSEARQRQQDRDRLKNALAKRLSVEVDQALIAHEGERAVANVEGLRFSLNYDDDLVLLRRCDLCGEDANRGFHSIESLANAESSELGYPHGNGECVKRREREQAKRQPTEERLLEALRDYIAEHSYQG